MEFSTAVLDDITELAKFARRTYQEAYQHEIEEPDLSEYLANEMSDQQFQEMFCVDQFFLVKLNSKIIGFAQFGPVKVEYGKFVSSFDPKGFELKRLYVDPGHQNLKLGTRLIDIVFNQPVLKTFEVLYITTWETNHGAKRLYKRVGFEEIGQIPDYDHKGKLLGYEIVLAKEFTSP